MSAPRWKAGSMRYRPALDRTHDSAIRALSVGSPGRVVVRQRRRRPSARPRRRRRRHPLRRPGRGHGLRPGVAPASRPSRRARPGPGCPARLFALFPLSSVPSLRFVSLPLIPSLAVRASRSRPAALGGRASLRKGEGVAGRRSPRTAAEGERDLVREAARRVDVTPLLRPRRSWRLLDAQDTTPADRPSSGTLLMKRPAGRRACTRGDDLQTARVRSPDW